MNMNNNGNNFNGPNLINNQLTTLPTLQIVNLANIQNGYGDSLFDRLLQTIVNVHICLNDFQRLNIN